MILHDFLQASKGTRPPPSPLPAHPQEGGGGSRLPNTANPPVVARRGSNNPFWSPSLPLPSLHDPTSKECIKIPRS